MDKRARDILFSTFWSSAGWKADRSVSPADFEYAKHHGLMFEPVQLDHQGVVRKAIAARSLVDLPTAADAFVASLSSRALDYRSSLGSYVALSHFPDHLRSADQSTCAICGAYNGADEESEDLSILQFERLKWGGVRHLQPVYAAFDLEQFALLPPRAPGPGDVRVLRALLASINGVAPGTTAAQLQAFLPAEIKSNRAERDILIGILGIAGVLETSNHRGFLSAFVPSKTRVLPDRRYVDMAYPACWWTGADGINWEAVELIFGHLLA